MDRCDMEYGEGIILIITVAWDCIFSSFRSSSSSSTASSCALGPPRPRVEAYRTSRLRSTSRLPLRC
jgi:hypothetical protein